MKKQIFPEETQLVQNPMGIKGEEFLELPNTGKTNTFYFFIKMAIGKDFIMLLFIIKGDLEKESLKHYC